MDWILQWDLEIMRWINVEWTSSFLDHFFVYMASFHLWKWPLVAAAVVAGIWGGFRWRAFMLTMLLCVLIGDTGITQTIKSTIDRPRPHESHEDLRRVRMEGWQVVAEPSRVNQVEDGNSMTSGHASNNVALATLATIFFRPWGAIMWIWAFLVCYSRIYTGDHYPTDILVSIPVALGYATGIAYFCAWTWRKYGARWFPKIYEQHPRFI